MDLVFSLYYATIVLALVVVIIIFIINKCWIILSLFITSISNYNQQKLYIISFMIISYPTMLTTIFIIFSFTPLATLPNISNGLWQFKAISQLGSLFGIYSITFIHLWFTVIVTIAIYNHWSKNSDMNPFNINKTTFTQNCRLFGAIFIFISLYGGFRLNVKHFYHKNPLKWHDNDLSLRTLCITENFTQNWQTQLIDVDLILTSEEYTTSTDIEYTQLQNLGRNVSQTYNHPVMIGIGIYDPDNSLELWVASQNNSINKVFTYLKGNPVPFVEDFEARRQDPPVVDMSSYGFDFSVSCLICFDMTFPDWSRLANKAALVLNPSWLWGSYIDQFVNLLSFRAIENGYNIYHCAVNGNTAAVNSYGQVVFKHANNQYTEHLTITEISGHTLWTLYANIGYVFDYFVMIFGLIYILLSVIVAWRNEYVLRCLKLKNASGDVKKLDIELQNGFRAEILPENEEDDHQTQTGNTL